MKSNHIGLSPQRKPRSSLHLAVQQNVGLVLTECNIITLSLQVKKKHRIWQHETSTDTQSMPTALQLDSGTIGKTQRSLPLQWTVASSNSVIMAIPKLCHTITTRMMWTQPTTVGTQRGLTVRTRTAESGGTHKVPHCCHNKDIGISRNKHKKPHHHDD